MKIYKVQETEKGWLVNSQDSSGKMSEFNTPWETRERALRVAEGYAQEWAGKSGHYSPVENGFEVDIRVYGDTWTMTDGECLVIEIGSRTVRMIRPGMGEYGMCQRKPLISDERAIEVARRFVAEGKGWNGVRLLNGGGLEVGDQR